MSSTNRNNLSRAAEDCLLLIHRMEERNEAPSTSVLAREMGVRDSTVTAMLKRLSQLQLLQYQARKEIGLTDMGKVVAQRLIRRHRLIETYLWVNLGYALGEVHDEAHMLEHAVSDRFVWAVSKSLGHPTVDPHGDPIPSESGDVEPRQLAPLSEMGVGKSGKLARILDTRPETLAHLEGLGLYIGAHIEVIEAPAADAIRRLRAGLREVVLSSALASQILIEDIPV